MTGRRWGIPAKLGECAPNRAANNLQGTRPLNRCILLLACLLAVTAVRADIYRWIDHNGDLQFGDRPPPEHGAESVELSPANRYSHRDIDLPKLERPQAGPAVVMYSAQWCGVCKRARRYFQDNRIPFREYDVETSDKGRREYRRLGGRGVPLILVGEQRMSGFSARHFEQLYRN